jgi:hypothetical protein
MSYIGLLNDKYRLFDSILTDIEDNKYNNGIPNIELLDDLYRLYNDVSEHLVKMISYPSSFDYVNIIPPNPYVDSFSDTDIIYTYCDGTSLYNHTTSNMP